MLYRPKQHQTDTTLSTPHNNTPFVIVDHVCMFLVFFPLSLSNYLLVNSLRVHSERPACKFTTLRVARGVAEGAAVSGKVWHEVQHQVLHEMQQQS